MITRLTVRGWGGTRIDLAGRDDTLVAMGVAKALLEETTHFTDHLFNELDILRLEVRVNVHFPHDLSGREGGVETQQNRVNDEAGDGGQEWDANLMQMGVDQTNVDISVAVDGPDASGDQDAKVRSASVVERLEVHFTSLWAARGHTHPYILLTPSGNFYTLVGVRDRRYAMYCRLLLEGEDAWGEAKRDRPVCLNVERSTSTTQPIARAVLYLSNAGELSRVVFFWNSNQTLADEALDRLTTVSERDRFR